LTAIHVGKLPAAKLRAGTRLHRIHQARFGPWFFDGSSSGRFNPTGTPARGTCYWAESPLGAWVESFRTVMTWSTGDIAARALSTIRLEADLRVCDLTVKKALRAGVTVSITGGDDYAAPQALADHLQPNFAGVRYRVRHDLSAELVAIGWFGDEGAAAGAALASLPTASTAPIDDELIDEAGREFGYRVLPLPP